MLPRPQGFCGVQKYQRQKNVRNGATNLVPREEHPAGLSEAMNYICPYCFVLGGSR